MLRLPVQPTLRYWVPVRSDPIAAFPFDADSDDETWYRLVLQPDAKSLADLADVACLILLGEPGLGKSTAVKQEVDRLEAALPADQDVLLLDLAVVSSDAGLDDAFRDRKVEMWVAGTGVLHLFLDGYDECLRQYQNLKARLLHRLAHLPVDRLRLRIACRSGDFPDNLPAGIHDLWRMQAPDAKDPVHQVRLEPLGRWDVRAWAEAAGFNSEVFLQAVDARNAQAFASRPIALQALISLFLQDAWPTTEVDLFVTACQDLCTEPDPDRPDGAPLTIEQRLAVAERIAALTLLANADAIWLGRPTERPTSALAVEALIGGSENVTGTRVDVDRRAIDDTLKGTALFEVQDHSLMRWSRRTYQEFLTARYFARRLRAKKTALQFFEHRGRPGSTVRSIAPQLIEAASWLAAMDEGVAHWIAEHDPAVLLRTRHHIFPALQSRLASWLLDEERAGRTVDLRRRGEEIRTALAHPEFCDQLRPVVTDHGADPEGRALACQLAAVCGCSTLENGLLDVAVQANEPLVVRRTAVAALGEIGSASITSQLLSLLNVKETSRDSWRLQVEVLMTVWPEHRSTGAVLDVLRTHHRNDDGDAGWRERRFVAHMGGDELLDALHWIKANAAKPDDNLEYLLGSIVARSASQLADDEMRTVLVQAMIARLDADRPLVPGNESAIIEQVNRQPEPVRQAFADALVHATPRGTDLHVLEFVRHIDLQYLHLVERAMIDGPAAPVWRRVVESRPTTWQDPDGLDKLRQTRQQARAGPDAERWLDALINQVLSPRLSEATETPRSDSRAQVTRQQHVEQLLAPPGVALDQQWIRLSHALNIDDSTGHWTGTVDLVETPGWQEAEESRRRVILDLAQALLSQSPALHPARGLDRRLATAGYQAATLLATAAPARLDAIDGHTWRYWLPGLASTAIGTAIRGRFHDVVAIAYRLQPQAVLDGLLATFAISTEPPPADALLDALDPYWDEELATALDAAVTNRKLPFASQIRCLTVLVRHDHPRAVERAFRWVGQPGTRRERAVKAAGTLLLNATSVQVARLVKRLSNLEPEFVQEVVRLIAETLGSPMPTGRFPATANERILADLYLLTTEHFPPSDDAQWSGTIPWSDPSFQMVQFRGALLRWLSDTGTWVAIEELARIIEEQPALQHPRARWHDAMRTTLHQTWAPSTTPQAIVELVADEQQRVVRNADQLLDLVLESLDRLQVELIQRGAVVDLWSEWTVGGKPEYRPKRELSVADYVKRFLDRDLAAFTVAANREVENRQGEETDILVEYLDRDSLLGEVRRLSVVIEVKCSFHGEVLTAMRTQLAERYLRDYQTDRGIYLVGWFNCERWDQSDHAWDRSRSHELDGLRATLEQQARDLTDERRRIEAVVLDAALRGQPSRSKRNRGTGARFRSQGN